MDKEHLETSSFFGKAEPNFIKSKTRRYNLLIQTPTLTINIANYQCSNHPTRLNIWKTTCWVFMLPTI